VRVSRAVNRLIDAGLVERAVSEADRRRSVLSLSKKGEAIYANIVPLARRAEGRLLETLNDAELDQLDRLLAKLQDRAAELFGPDSPDFDSPND